MPRLLTISCCIALAASGLASAVARPAPGEAGRATSVQVRPGNDDKTLVIYPNPSTGIVHLTINGQEGRRVELQVLNVIGSVIYRETMSDLNDRATKVLDLSRFANGLYYVKLEGGGTNQMSKLVIH